MPSRIQLAPSAEASDDQRLRTVAIDITYGGAGDSTIWTPPNGTRWVLKYLFFRVSAAANLYLKSGSTALGGTATWVHSAAGDRGPIHANGFPVAVGRSMGDALVLTSSAACDVDGWVVVGAVAGAGPS